MDLNWVTALVYAADLVIRVGLALHVLRRRLPVGEALAWLGLILVFPFAGGLLYLLFGLYRLGPRRTRRIAAVQAVTRDWRVQTPSGEDRLDPAGQALARLGETLLEAPLLSGNRLELLPGAERGFQALLADLDRATATCDIESYIWSPGGWPDDVAEALLRAARRGVACRVLLDAVGSKDFLASSWPRRLAEGGVRVQAALLTGALRALVARPDLRLHRKIVVIDGNVAYAGSLNMADPRLFKKHVGVGEWVDALARIEGPAVDGLNMVFLRDWAIEADVPPDQFRARPIPAVPAGEAAVQILPSGPYQRVRAIEQVVLGAIYAAEREVVLTTPYFVPTESLQTALMTAAARGAAVTLIVPTRVDSRLAALASRAYLADLRAGGAHVALYRDGLLHTKSITVDGRFSLFGSLNLDPRSLHLDFEVTLAVYDAGFTAALRALQEEYLGRSQLPDVETLRPRSAWGRLGEDVARLLGPVL